MQVLQLQTTSASPQSPPVDHQSGIEAMVLAILQQTNVSQQSELGDTAGLALQLPQDDSVQQGLLLNAYSGFLADALASNAMVQLRLSSSSTPSLIPVSQLCAKWIWQPALPTSLTTASCYLEF